MLYIKYFYTISLILLFCLAARAQGLPSFDIVKRGNGKQSVILLAGLASSSQVWDETVAILSKTKTCYAISFSGFAGNKPQLDPNMKLWERDIVKFIRDKKIKNPVLIGHSLGGTIALEIAADYPDIISKLIVVDAFPSPAALYNQGFKKNENFDCTRFVSQFVNMSDGDFYNMQRTNISQMVTDKKRMEQILDWAVKSDRKTYGKIYCELLNIDLREKIPAIKTPTLILLQPVFKSKEQVVNRQYALLKKATIKYADKGLHFIMYDDPNWFIKSLQSFLK